MASGPPATATYTIAWIAALPHERAAALELLDEEYRRPKDFKKNPSDGNSYSWGRMGDHNIVIASLPDGVYGTTTAAVTAARLVSSLPHIRVGLLVGIGAGITGETRNENGQLELKHDILLGDVVVSRPGNGQGGVVLHDVIKAKTIDGKKVTTLNGQLNQPPDALLNALGALKAQHLRRPSEMLQLLTVFKRNDIMKDTFVYPGAEHDPVRKAMQASSANSTRNAPRIHYGTIASGNKLIKNAEERDDITNWLRENNIDPICFEMEAGGLMNNFPCIVIRGICDYADERKNDIWQNYAAATAAAFAKEFLDYLEADEVHGEDTLAAKLGVQLGIQDVQSNTSRLLTSTAEKEMKELQNWLCSTDYTSQLHEHQNNYHDGTVSWFFEDERFKNWIQAGQGSVLLCEGHPGTGKSTLASHVIEVLERNPTSDNAVPVLYLFFNHKMQDTQTAHHVLGSLLAQLVPFLPEVPATLLEAYKKKERLTLTMLHSFLRATRSGLEDHVVVLDALDEASSGVCNDLIPRLCGLAMESKLHFLATSRCLPSIQTRFDSCPCLEIAASSSDVESYVRRRTLDFRGERLRTPDLVDATVASILTRCSGMFLLARLLMDILVASVATPASLKRALEDLPTGENAYKPAYDSILERITSQQGDFRSLGLECLAWVVFAKRPLTLEEVGHALATKTNGDKFNPEDVPDLESLPSLCAGLITISYETRTVSLVHLTAHEYLVTIRNQWFPQADFLLADKCLKYLISASAHIPQESLTVRDYGDYQFYFGSRGHHTASWSLLRYAVFQWWKHVKDVDVNPQYGCEQIEALSLRVAKVSANPGLRFWLAVAGRQSLLISIPEINEQTDVALRAFTIWHAVAAWDLARLCDVLLTKANYVNSTYAGRTPLALAARFGSTGTARTLLNSTCAHTGEVDDRCCGYGLSILGTAAYHGHASFVEMFLDRMPPTDCNVRHCCNDSAALVIAAEKCHSQIVNALLEKARVDVNWRNSEGKTALLAAAQIANGKGNDILQILLSHQATDVNVLDKSGRTALLEAARIGDNDIVSTLLSHQAIDVNISNKSGRTALLEAARMGNRDIVSMLLSHQALNVNISDDFGRTALLEAARMGDKDMVSMLLSCQTINVDISDKSGWTALFEAARIGSEDIVSMLLSRQDVDVNKIDRDGDTSLSIAAYRKHDVVVRMLLRRTDIEIVQGSKGKNALWNACSGGCTSIIKMLLESEAFDLESLDREGNSPLIPAGASDHTNVVQMLAARGANVAARDGPGLMALIHSAVKGNTRPVTEFLRHLSNLDDLFLSGPDRRVLCAGYLVVWLAIHEARVYEKDPDPAESYFSRVRSLFAHFDDGLLDLDPYRMKDGLLILRRFPAVFALFESAGGMISRVTNKLDQGLLFWFSLQLLHTYPSSQAIQCDCGNDCTSNVPVYWYCSRCCKRSSAKRMWLKGLSLLPECVHAGAWCIDWTHSMKKIDLRPLYEGYPAAFVYPFPTRAYQEPPVNETQLRSCTAEIESRGIMKPHARSTAPTSVPSYRKTQFGFWESRIPVGLWKAERLSPLPIDRLINRRHH